ncbi:acyl-n-acyltransferase [Favolaschia claudopus]|uniref:Acyl-n-acyltransferase n=1 Tax=Favolaschia claudopus TaxID=2862362 RepID=A0AAW0DAP9_9AGAR
MPKPLPSGLQLRQARIEEVVSLANLLYLAPDDGTVYSFPHALEQPDEMKHMNMKWLQSLFHDPTSFIRIAVVTVDGNEQIVGFTNWKKREAEPQNPSKTRLVKLTDEVVAAENNDTASASDSPRAPVPNKARREAINRARQRAPSPDETIPCYGLSGLVIHPEYQGHGIGSLLVRWGLDKAADEHIPVFIGGEARGVNFYEKALGFKRLHATEYWLDAAGRDISREEVESGNEAWKFSNGGVSGAEVAWLPKGYILDWGGEILEG